MNTLVELIQTHGLWMVFLITLLQSIGLPLPAFTVLILTTAVTPLNAMNVAVLILAGSLGTLIGDFVLYSAGKKYGTSVLGKLCRISMSPDTCVRSTSDIFDRYGAPALTIIKFIPGLSTLAPVVAGVYAMSLKLFTLFSTIAALLYIGVAVSLGAFFRHEISSFITALSRYGKLGGLFVVVLFTLYLLFKWLQRYRLIKRFKTDRLTVNDLVELIERESELVILDARPADQRTRNGFIPGSVPVDENSLSKIADRHAGNQEIVIYCACPNEITAARYAEKLRRVGFKRIRPLLGGIDAWARSGREIAYS
ncbi:MAG: DedA family protein/thiosulfate sulfurtransferase GlpE [Mucilaginibacter sp.]|uniref:DedA family protein/thiosulfate sulfurtransferase GlpE n=1 Tax=Mucilaginibacter sp. TaxID=1882438 RepID=UPI0031A78C76